MKCLPSEKLSLAGGVTLHDWHAEVLALRAFNRFLIQECSILLEGLSSPWVTRQRDSHDANTLSPPFSVTDGVEIHMYCSEAPCGDASMELVMEDQDDSTPWTVVTSSVDTGREHSESHALRGRGYFSQLGAVRTKPCQSHISQTGINLSDNRS